MIAFIGGTDEEIKTGKGTMLMTTTQAAAKLGINERHLRNLVEKDAITPYEERVFNVALFSVADVERLRVQRLRRGF